MILWTLVIIFEIRWLHASNDAVSNDVVTLIQFTHRKYCGEHNCTSVNNISEFSDSFSTFPFKDPFCPPCHKCSCRYDCVIFGECCPDLYIGPPLYPFRCVGLPFMKNVIEKYFVVTDCSPTSKNYSRALAEKCHSFQLHRRRDRLVSPVVSSAGTETQVTFSNRFCAECHGISNAVPWKVVVQCEVFPKPNDMADFEGFTSWAANNCWVGFVVPNNSIRKCMVLDTEIRSACNETGDWNPYNATIAKACSSYYNPMIREKFRNIFCFLCNGFPEDILQDQVQCPETPRLGWTIRPFSAILDFDTMPEFALSNQCKEAEYEDKISNMCRKILCPLLQKLSGENCTRFITSAHGIVFKLTIALIPLEPLVMSPILSNIRRYLIKRIYDHREILTLNVTVVSYVYETPQPEVKENCERQNQNGSGKAHGIVVNPSDPESANTASHQSTEPPKQDVEIVAYVKITALVTPSLTARISDLEEGLLALQDEHLVISETKCITFNSTPFIYFNPKEYNISNEGLRPVLTDRFNAPIPDLPPTTSFLEIPSPHLECPQIEFQEKEYERAMHDSVFVITDSIYIHEPNYEITESLKLRVCLDHLNQVITSALRDEAARSDGTSADTNTYVMQILTSVCLGVSLVCLLLCFLTHSLFAEMRTLPGINLMFLTSSLFVAHGLYLFGAGATDNRVVCVTMAILIHYSWLVAFAWMNVCSFHVFRVFRKLFYVLTFNDKKMILLRYMAFSYIVPAILIVLYILVHYFALEESSVGYSYEMSICFIKPGLLSIPFFALPAGLTVCFSTALFVYTSIILHKSSKERSALGINESVSIFRFFKLASMTGLSWLFGFLGAILKINVLAYIFIILAGGQGLFIFLSFSFSRQIWNKYVSCLCCARKRKEQLSENIVSTVLENLSQSEHFDNAAVENSSSNL